MQSTYSQNNSRRSLVLAGLGCWVHSLHTHSLLSVSHRTEDVIQSRIKIITLKNPLLALWTEFGAYWATKFKEFPWKWKWKASVTVLFLVTIVKGMRNITQQVEVSLQNTTDVPGSGVNGRWVVYALRCAKSAQGGHKGELRSKRNTISAKIQLICLSAVCETILPR